MRNAMAEMLSGGSGYKKFLVARDLSRQLMATHNSPASPTRARSGITNGV
jgi:hypothetical protein